MSEIEGLERRILGVESALILLSIAAIAAADRLLAPGDLARLPVPRAAELQRAHAPLAVVRAAARSRRASCCASGTRRSQAQSWGRLALDWTLVAALPGRGAAAAPPRPRARRSSSAPRASSATSSCARWRWRPPSSSTCSTSTGRRRGRSTSSPAPSRRRWWAATTTTSCPSRAGASRWWSPTSRARACRPRSSCPR